VTDDEWGAATVVAMILLTAAAVVALPPGRSPRGGTLAALLLGLGVVLAAAWTAWVLCRS
jgi:hypothetical protein